MADTNGDVAPQTNGHTASPGAAASAAQAQQPPSSSVPAPGTISSATVTAPTPSAPLTAVPGQPAISLHDDGTAKRPRDARLIHMLLTSLGVSAYQERVPLQLLDFAYRHTSSILTDAVALSPDTMIPVKASGGSKDKDKDKDKLDDSQINMNAVHLAIAGRLGYQFHGGGASGGLAKEFMLDLAEKRNAVALPKVFPNEWGVRLPSERFVLTGVPWSLKDTWEGADDEDDDDMETGDDEDGAGANGEVKNEPEGMEGVEGGDEEGEGRMEDIFGEGDGEDIDME